MPDDAAGSAHLSRHDYEVLLRRAQSRRRARRAWQFSLTATFVLLVGGAGLAIAYASHDEPPGAVTGPVDTTPANTDDTVIYIQGPSSTVYQHTCTADGENFRVEVRNTSTTKVVAEVTLSGVINASLSPGPVTLAAGQTQMFEATIPVPEAGTYGLTISFDSASSGSTDTLAACPG